MKYRVIIQPPAIADLEEAYRWAENRAPLTAARWFHRFSATLQSLDTFPQRWGFAAENEAVEPEIRQLLFGKKPNVFRVLFTIVGDTVYVLHFRRASQQTMTAGDLRKSLPPTPDVSKPSDDVP